MKKFVSRILSLGLALTAATAAAEADMPAETTKALSVGSVTVYDYHAEPLQQKTVTDFAQGKGLSFLNEQDRRKLSKAISRATPEAKSEAKAS